MARIDWVKDRLEAWAIWSMRNAGGARGFAKESILVSETWSRGSYNHMPIPVNEQECWDMDRAVAALKLSKSHLFLTLVAIYLQDKGVLLVAQEMGRSPATIHAQLDQADRAIAAWFGEQWEARERAKAQAAAAKQGGFTS